MLAPPQPGPTHHRNRATITPLTKKNAAVTIAALSLLGTVAGCASTTTATSGSGTAGSTTSDTTTGPYTDGTYDASGSYQSPNGTVSIDVEVTLAADTITAVTVKGNGESPDSKRYQGEFIAGISDVVVGKNIDEIKVDKVAGSSLTSGGFNDAIAAIKSEAVTK